MNSTHYDPTKLVEARELMGKSQQDIATELNVDRQTIYRLEAGKSVSYEKLVAICRFYRIPVTNILHPFPEVAAV